jgi:hypothetical protein
VLHNTLGAWWAGKVLEWRPELAEAAPDEASLRRACSPPGYAFEMLRFVKEGERWRPAAGVFSGWPKDAKDVTVLDPCCGSGHFLTEALAILVALRRAEEGTSAAEAAAAVLRDNLFGLEIDGRCVQLAVFAVVLAAWRLGGWQSLPLPHIAWSGAPPPLPKPQFVALAEGNTDLARALAAIHEVFRQAPLLGSLIEPTGGDLIDPVRVARVETMLERVIEHARAAEPDRAEGAIAARGMADAVAILARRYTLQATNVPFLGRSKQAEQLSTYIGRRFNLSKANLATCTIERMLLLSAGDSSIAFVAPQEWFFLGTFKRFRRMLLETYSVNFICDLGPAAFRDMNWWAARTALGIFTNRSPTKGSTYQAIDGDTARDLDGKPNALLTRTASSVVQVRQLEDPDAVLSIEPFIGGPKLRDFADTRQGIGTADLERFLVYFWEVADRREKWDRYQTAPENDKPWSGRNRFLRWENGHGALANSSQARVCGQPAWGRKGIAVAVNRDLPRTLYTGEKFDCTVAIIVPRRDEDHPALVACALSEGFGEQVRGHDQALSVTESSFGKVDFDNSKWHELALITFKGTLPEPYSRDPSLWVFHGHPADTAKGSALHVALARLCGYCWPAETDAEISLSAEGRDWVAKAAILPAGDDDGLLALPAVAGERPLIERFRGYLATAFGAEWSDALERRLVAEADEVFDKRPARDESLEAWLRDRAFRQHCALFRRRPFLWHIWDAQPDGFAAFLNYHRLTRANVEKLTFSLLGDWIARMRDAGDQRRLEAAQILQEKLQSILKGESPLDIFVRWKAIEAQPMGWEPDLDDGVRLNIRPFVRTDVLRVTPNIHWRKDAGRDAPTAPWYGKFKGERINDHHLTIAEKNVARPEAATRVA